MFVRVGDQVRLEDLLRVVIQSGNDASVALVESSLAVRPPFRRDERQAALLGMKIPVP